VNNRAEKSFLLWISITIVCLYLVILAGSVVRATGSGMGCPDWPKCFGYYIPPTDPSQLEFHPDHEYKKGMMIIVNDTLWRAPVKFVSGDSFDRVNWEKYPAHNYAKFFAAHTWTEYINRLLGAISGFASLMLLYFAVRRFRKDKLSLLIVLVHLFVIGFVAWLGKVVVDSNLKPVTITLHMLCAIVMVFLMIWLRVRIREQMSADSLRDAGKTVVSRTLFTFTGALLAITLMQIILGTQVRQEVDVIYKLNEGLNRGAWIDQLSQRYVTHYSIAIAVLLMNLTVWYLLRSYISNARVKRLLHAQILVLLAAYGVGVFMHNFSIPAYAQPAHLLMAMILAGVQFALVLNLKKE
jgi:cytochrome c oxidase assembly protein subunit 15